MNKRKAATLFLLIGVVITVFFFYRSRQPVITYSQCPLCDGNQYQEMFNYVAGNTADYKANFPYYSRIMVPALVAVFSGQDILWGFQVVNLIFSILAVLSLYYLWNQLDVPLYLIGLALGWLLFHWTGLIRLNALDPVTVDLPTYLIQTLFVLVVINKRYQWLLLIAPIAVLQRESITVLLFILIGYELVKPKLLGEEREWKYVWLILISILMAIGVKYIFSLFYPPLEVGKSSVRLVGFYIKEVIQEPFKLIRWLVGIFMAYGVLFMLALLNIKKEELKSSLSIFSIAYLLLGLIAGGDYTRIVFLGFPFIMTWVLITLKKVSPFLVFIAFGLSVYQMRLFSIIPDPGKDFWEFASWYPEFANHYTVIGWLIFLAVCFAIIATLNRFFQKESN